MNGELLVTLALPVAFLARAVENNVVIGQFMHETAAQQSAGEGRAKSARPSAKRVCRAWHRASRVKVPINRGTLLNN